MTDPASNLSGRAKRGVALAGVPAGQTALCSLGPTGHHLYYRGHDILAALPACSYEEVAFLLLHGELPTVAQLAAFDGRVQAARTLPPALRALLESIPAGAHPMEVLRSTVSLLGCLEPEAGDGAAAADAIAVAERLLGAMPAALCYWHHFAQAGTRIDTAGEGAGVAAHLLALLHQRRVPAGWQDALRATLVLYAEHEFTASSFAARVVASTGSDLHSALCGALGALRGPRHGGANEAAMRLQAGYGDAQCAVADVRARLARRELVIGFGHPLYAHCDPRSEPLRAVARALATASGDQQPLQVAEAIEAEVRAARGLFPNVDWYAATAWRYLGVPPGLCTPLFAIARTAAWVAHVLEQRADGRIIRPAAAYAGPAPRPWVPVGERRPAL